MALALSHLCFYQDISNERGKSTASWGKKSSKLELDVPDRTLGIPCLVLGRDTLLWASVSSFDFNVSEAPLGSHVLGW